MKRPSWATTIGILGIIFGILGVSGGAQEMAMPSMFEMQKDMMTSLSEGTDSKGEDIPKVSWEIEKDGEIQKIKMAEMFENLQEQFQLPEWYKSWAAAIGGISMLAAALYLLSGIFLLMTKPIAITLFYTAIGVSITWAIIQATLYTQAGSGMLMAQIPGFMASIVIDIVLLVVVLAGNKEAFHIVAEENNIS